MTPEQIAVLLKVAHSEEVQLLIGGGEWDLTEEDEDTLWGIIDGHPLEGIEEVK